MPRHGKLFAELAAFDDSADALFDHAPTADLLAEAAAVLAQASAPTFAAKGAELRDALAARAADQVTAALLTQAGEPRKFGKLGSDATLRAAQDALQRILAAGQQHQAWQHQQRLVARLARCLAGVFAEAGRARAGLDMGDLERAAQLLLTDEVLAGWVQQRLDDAMRQLLIDEFMDTSPVQWQASRDWLSGYAGAGGGGAIFGLIVGDQAEHLPLSPRRTAGVPRCPGSCSRALEGERLACDHTRRNAPGVIEVVNATLLAAQKDGAYEGSCAWPPRCSRPAGHAAGAAADLRAEREGEGRRSRPAGLARHADHAARRGRGNLLRAQEVAQAARWVQARSKPAYRGPAKSW